MKEHKSDRLKFSDLELNDYQFIIELLNTPGWLKFIGDRNVKSRGDAEAYIRKILDHAEYRYWVVRTIETLTPIGVVTLIKRDYLEHHDIGFAFLPGYAGNGYAYEASNYVMNEFLRDYRILVATTVPDNIRSIRLLEKLGFKFDREIVHDYEKLLVYCRKINPVK